MLGDELASPGSLHSRRVEKLVPPWATPARPPGGWKLPSVRGMIQCSPGQPFYLSFLNSLQGSGDEPWSTVKSWSGVSRLGLGVRFGTLNRIARLLAGMGAVFLFPGMAT